MLSSHHRSHHCFLSTVYRPTSTLPLANCVRLAVARLQPYTLPHFGIQVANQNRLRSTDVGRAVKSGEDLAAPITFTPYKNDDHTNRYVSMLGQSINKCFPVSRSSPVSNG
mmetsp:Transcript_17472/g.48473  ORF Transcript_17472/g.48473 Transcript_17472/m.48473 type:complete len:111 (-) Transcript_17472:1384-1716(-)